MARTPKKASAANDLAAIPDVSLGTSLSKTPQYKGFEFWLVGQTPLICHAWSHKAKEMMLWKQVKAVKGAGREERDPQKDFLDSLYHMDEEGKTFGFPVTAFKLAFLSVAHKDRGIARTDARLGLYFQAAMVAQRPALAGARCDLPLVRIFGSDPVMREDMGNVGTGLTRKANLIYRSQFDVWAVKMVGKYNTGILTEGHVMAMANNSGIAVGVGDWRNEKDGSFGGYSVASPEEAVAWDAFAAGKGPLPMPEGMKLAAE